MSTGTRPKETLAFSVENFGPIAKARFDLRPLTVFVGPSNTGKSYLAMLVYAMHDGFRKGLRFSTLAGDRWHKEFGRLSAAERRAVRGWLADYAGARPDDPGGIPPLPPMVEKAAQRAVREMRGFDTDVAESIRRCFGKEDLGGLVYDRATHPARVRTRMPGVPGRAEIDMGLGPGGITLAGHVPTAFSFKPRVTIGNLLPEPLLGMERDERAKSCERTAYGAMVHLGFRQVFAALACPAHYLPASRTGIMDIRKVVMQALVEHSELGGIRPAVPLPRFPGTITDFIVGMAEPGESNGHYSEVAREIERDILEGAIIEERTNGAAYPDFFYRPRKTRDGRKIPLMGASTTVSELAPVVLSLRGFVQEGDVLIIEEPESHLHPAMQAKLAVQLARLAHSGLRVIVTTHSEWVLEQFANLVGAFGPGDSASVRAESECPDLAGAALRSEDVGVWLFSPRRTSGVTVGEIKLDAEAGVFPAGFDEVAWALHNGWADVRSIIERERKSAEV